MLNRLDIPIDRHYLGKPCHCHKRRPFDRRACTFLLRRWIDPGIGHPTCTHLRKRLDGRSALGKRSRWCKSRQCQLLVRSMRRASNLGTRQAQAGPSNANLFEESSRYKLPTEGTRGCMHCASCMQSSGSSWWTGSSGKDASHGPVLPLGIGHSENGAM